MRRGVILYGPPASGKSTVTVRLQAIDSSVMLFPRLKCGHGKTGGYRMVDTEELARLRRQGDLIWENERYGSTYAIDNSGLRASLRAGTPVIHLGQADGVRAVVNASPGVVWLTVELWCPRNVAQERIQSRGDERPKDRLMAWDETQHLRDAHMTFDTSQASPDETARSVLRELQKIASPEGGLPR